MTYDSLFAPLAIGGLTAKNRIMSAPMSAYVDMHGQLTRENAAEYEIRAMGGAGIVYIGESVVCSETGQAHFPMLRLDDPETVSSLLPVAEKIHRHGAIAGIELLHAGNRTNPQYITGDRVYGPSAMERGMYGAPVYALTEEDLEILAERFGRAAALAKYAGLDICMIHGGHGWLLSQFLSPLDNHRTDRFGGSFENRVRFPLMVVDAVRRHVGPDYPLDFRLSGSELAEGGVTLEESIALGKLLEDRVDMLNVSAGTFRELKTSLHMFPPAFIPAGSNVQFAEAIRREVSIPVATLGGLGEPELMAEIVSDGKADVITLGRPMLADPFLPKKLLEGREREITHCLRCTECTSSGFVPHVPFALHQLRCSVNPWTGHELDYLTRSDRPERARQVLVIGGGPAGMQAAVSAAEQGHSVTLCEASDRLGGTLLSAEHLPFKRNLIRLIETLEEKMRVQGVKVELNTPVDPAGAKAMAPEVLIVATGADPVRPPIPGANSDSVIMSADLHRAALPGQQVVIIGGGLIGCEEGYYLCTQGKDVTILEMLDTLAPTAPFQYRMCMLDYMERAGVTAETGVTVTGIEPGAVRYTKDGRETRLAADHVVLAAGTKARRDRAEAFRQSAPTVRIIGDAARAGRVMAAIRDGHYAGYYIQ